MMSCHPFLFVIRTVIPYASIPYNMSKTISVVSTLSFHSFLIIFIQIIMQRESNNARLSFAEQNISNNEIYRGIYELSHMNTGDQLSHLANTHDRLVLHHKWLSETQYKEVLDLCWSLPGPTTLQVIITIVTLKTRSLMVGVNSFIIYNTLPWIFLTILGLLSNTFIQSHITSLPLTMRLFFMGFNAATAGIMVRNFISYISESWLKWPKMLLTLVTAVIFYCSQTLASLLACLALGAVVSLYQEIEDTRKKMSTKSYEIFKRIEFNFILGKPSIWILLTLLVSMWVYFSIYPQDKYNYVFGFYIVSCLIIGPIEVVLAYLLSVLTTFGHLNSQEIWIGLPVAFLLPGTHINVGIYFGSMIDGVRGALLSAVALFVPSFLFLYGLLPQWIYYRDRQGIKRLYQGLICSTTGLTLAMICLILKHCISVDLATTICIFIVSAYVNYFIGKYSFAIILLGGLLAYLRYISVMCYRKGEYCPFPFNF